MWGSFVYHILQEFNTLYLTRFRTYKITIHPKLKPRRGGGLKQITIITTCRKVPLQVKFSDDIMLCILLKISLNFRMTRCNNSHAIVLMSRWLAPKLKISNTFLKPTMKSLVMHNNVSFLPSKPLLFIRC